jgi:hypothetical protein
MILPLAGTPIQKRTIWDLAILVLGLNIWVSFLLLPVLHLERPPSSPVIILLCLALLTLLLGTWARNGSFLLGAYPLIMLLGVLLAPSLTGENVYSPWSFVLVALSFLAYLLVSPLLLQLIDAPRPIEEGKHLEDLPLTSKWRRRLRMYRWLAGLAALFPAVLLFALFLHPGIEEETNRHFPGRINEARALFGVLLLVLWLGIFHSYFLAPLKQHIRGDPQIRFELQRLRRLALRRNPRGSFYLFVALALVLMLLLVLVHW